MKIKIVGIGSEGSRSISRLIKVGIKDVNFITVETDAKVLLPSKTDEKIKPNLISSRVLNTNSVDLIKEALQDSELVFVITDGTSGIDTIPIIAKITRDIGSLSIGFMIRKMGADPLQTEHSAQVLRKSLDTFIVLPKDELLTNTTNIAVKKDAYLKSDEMLSTGIKDLTRLFMQQSILEVNLTDMKNIFQEVGETVLVIGKATGHESARNAGLVAISTPHFRDRLKHTKGMLIIITGSSQLTLFEINDAVQVITKHTHDNANIIFGCIIDESLNHSVEVTVFATDFDSSTNIYEGIHH